MRPTQVLLLTRKPQLGMPPFKELQPLVLKPQIAGKGHGSSMPSCVHEISILFACLSSNDFRDSECAKEAAALNNCYRSDLKSRFQSKQNRMAGGLVEPNQRKLTKDQVNQVLKRYPPTKTLPERSPAPKR